MTVTGSAGTRNCTVVRSAASICVRRSSPYSRASASISWITCRRSLAGLASSASGFRFSSRRAASSLPMRIASSRASWRRRISRMSSACRALSPKRSISAGAGSSDSRMTRITSSMCSRTSSRPSSTWIRSSTRSRRWRLRRSTVSTRNAHHSARIVTRFFWRGRPSRPIITRLTATPASRLVCARSTRSSSSGSTRDVFGSTTSRTGASRPDSSRTASSTASTACFSCPCSAVSAFRPARSFGLTSSSISSSTRCAETPCGRLVKTSCHCPRANSSTMCVARMRIDPRPLDWIARRSSADEMICPPPGKSGPGTISCRRAASMPGSRRTATAAAAISRRLCGGISVAMPTAMPDAPLSRTIGRRAGNRRGSSVEPS